jgi:uncharacterized protein
MPAALLAGLALALAGCGGAAPQGDVAAADNAGAAKPHASPSRALPALSGRVVDMANLLSADEEAALTARLAAFERESATQLVVVTTPSLEGETIEAYGERLGNGWRVGPAEGNNGVLLIVAPADRQTRIAVGRGLGSLLTDARAKEIIDRDLLPRFRASRWREGIEAGTQSIIAVLTAAERGQR